MTVDQLIVELFDKHWLVTTLLAPVWTFLFAWVTDQTAWWMGSGILMAVYVGLFSAF